VTLSDPGQDAYDPQVVTDGSTITAVWQRSDGSNSRIQASSYPTAGSPTLALAATGASQTLTLGALGAAGLLLAGGLVLTRVTRREGSSTAA
jgi:LPXTG-motif cell wall-anchored protein